jgi:hypothetical protein
VRLVTINSVVSILLAAVKNHTFFGDGQGKGGLGEMPSAAVGAQSCACIPVNRGSAGNPPCDAPSGWTATERTRSADLTVLRLQVGEMLLSPQDIQTLMQTKAEADLRKTQIPASAESYEAKLPEGFRLPDGMAFQFDANSPAFADSRRWAFANGLTQKQFGEMLGFYASTQVADHQLMTAAAQKQVELLGVNSAARVSAVEQFIRGFAGDELGTALRQSIFTAKQVQAWEKIIGQVGSQGVASYRAHGREPPTQAGKVDDATWERMSVSERYQYSKSFDQRQFRNNNGG